jgi:hypothetical protein
VAFLAVAAFAVFFAVFFAAFLAMALLLVMEFTIPCDAYGIQQKM